MKQGLPLLTLIALLLAACMGAPISGQSTPTPAAQATPTPVGTWEMVIEGMVYDQATGQPIAGASISYLVVVSHFPEIQIGRSNQTTSDEQGKFALPMIVHDTDNVRLVVAAEGYTTYEKKVDLLGDRTVKVGLNFSQQD